MRIYPKITPFPKKEVEKSEPIEEKIEVIAEETAEEKEIVEEEEISEPTKKTKKKNSLLEEILED